jgi:membrane-bound lytic murein transglycosylase A
VVLEKTHFSKLYKWDNENYREALDVFLKSCNKIMSLSLGVSTFPQLNTKINKNDFYAACKVGDVIRHYNEKYIKVFFESYFTPYKVNDGSRNSLFTGYYVPTIRAKMKKDRIFKYPIYGRPDDVMEGIKYYTREEINNGILEGRNLEILYTDDPVELFFLHIQGSGNARLVDEGKIVSIGFDGKNNHKFSSIGNYMKKNNMISDNNMSSKGIKAELKRDLDLAKQILNINKSYIFLKILNDNRIRGAFDTELVPLRTIAVDKRYIPLGFPLWLNTTHNKKNENEEFNKIVVANDTGSAIRGVVRGDIFFGFGEQGENDASFQYSHGEYYLLIPTKIVDKYDKK